MIDINELRRLAQAALIGPDGVSMRWLNLLKDFQEEANPSEVLDLLDRLEAAESETASWKGLATQFGQEADALRAKIAEMENQEPVAWLHETRRDSDVVTDAVKHVWGKAVVGSLAAYSIPLYLAPGAKGETK